MADGVISYEDAIGAAPVPAAAVLAPASAPAGDAPSDMASYADRPLTVHARAPSAPTAPVPDAPPTASVAPAAPGIISYEDATTPTTKNPGGVLSNAADDGYLSGALKGLGTAAIKGAGNAAGFVGGLGNLTDYLLARAESKITGQPVEGVLADLAKSKQAQQQHAASIGLPDADPRNVLPTPESAAAPILKQTGEYVPTTEPGKLLQAGAEAAFSSLGPGVGAASGPARQILAAAPAMAAGNAAAGAVGQGVTDLTGDPLLGMGAGLVGGAAVQGGGAAVKKIAAPAVMGIPGIDAVPVIGPAVAAARDNAAAGQVLSKSADPAALREWAAQPAQDSTVPNSPQTLAGAVGDDRGLFQAEKDARNTNNQPFNAVDTQQSTANKAAITAAQPEGDVFRPGQVIRQRLDAIDQAAQQAEDRLTAAHQEAVTARAQGTQQAQDRMAQAFADAHARAAQAATDAAAPLRDLPAPEEAGAALRAAQQEATDAAKQARKALYDAVDPDGTLATVVTPLKEAKNAIREAIDPHTGVQPSGAEAKLWSDIDRLPDVVPFKSLQTLDTRVTAAMADARRNPNPEDPQAISRLTQLKSATMDAIHNGVENQAAHEARMVASGVMTPEDTIEGRWERALEHSRNQFYEQSADAGRAVAAGTGTYGSSGSGSVRAAAGRASSARGGSYDTAGSAGVASDAGLAPNFDPAASERLTAAKAGHAAYAQTHQNPTVKPVLDTNGFAGQYKLPNGAIPAKAIVAGDKGFETANAFLVASGRDPRAVSAMQTAALAPLAKAMVPVGNIHPNALARWKENYGGALRALDAVSPGFSSRFDTAAGATQALLDAGVEHKQALSDFQRQSAAAAIEANKASLDATRSGVATARQVASDARATPAAQFAGQGGDRIAPAEVENAVGNMLKTGTQGATRMRSLVATVSKDPDALAGLRKAGVDWMIRTHQNADGSLSGAKFISFVRNNRAVLKELYPTKDVSMFGAVADRIEADARWRTETAVKGGSDTAKNMKPMLEKAVEDTKQHLSIMGAATAGFLAGGPKGAAGGASLFLLNSLRSAGVRSVSDLYHEALVDPDKARFLISKMPATIEGGKLTALSGALRRDLLVGQQLAPAGTLH